MDTLAKRLKHARKTRGLSQAELANRLGVGQSTIASIENGRNQGSKFLVAIARELGTDAAWLEAGDGAVSLPPISTQGFSPLYEKTGMVTIRQYETGGSMGRGVELRDQPGEIVEWRVTKPWLEKNVRNFSSPKNLHIVTGFGDSMKPMFNPGDPLIVDAGVKTVDYDAVYFFRVDNEGFIKRLQRIPGKGLVAISENPAYRDWVIEQDMNFEVFGRVLKVWRSEEF